MAITAFMAAAPDMKLVVPATKNPNFEAFYLNGVQSTLLKFVEMDPYTWSVPPLERACIDFDKLVVWTGVRSSYDSFHIVYTVLDDLLDGCSIDDDVLAKRTIRVVPPYDRHLAEWICGAADMCVIPELSIPTSWRVLNIPRSTFTLKDWEFLTHDARGSLPFTFM